MHDHEPEARMPLRRSSCGSAQVVLACLYRNLFGSCPLNLRKQQPQHTVHELRTDLFGSAIQDPHQAADKYFACARPFSSSTK